MKKYNFINLVSAFIALPVVVMGFAVAASAADGTKVSGFANAQFHMTEKASTSNGFVVHDGAVYLTHNMGKAKVHIDLPFSGGGANNNFAFATTRPQAYVHYAYDHGLHWTMGQFDNVYGFEGVDTADIFFSRRGLLANTTRGNVHTGFMLGYKFTDQFELSALISNRNGGTRHDDNYEYGGKFSYNGLFNFSVGYLHHKQRAQSATDFLVDVVAGLSVSNFTFDAEFDAFKNAALAGDSGVGFMGQITWKCLPKFAVGVRPEFLRKNPGGAFSTFQVTAGPQYQMNDHLTTKLDYTLMSTKQVDGGTSESTHAGVLAALYTF